MTSMPTETARMPAPAAMAARVMVAGHLGEFLQGRLGPGGPVALISLPCPALVLSAEFFSAGAGLTLGGDAPRLVSKRAARRMLARLGRSLRGRVRMSAAMPAGGGAGASTAALVALARLAGGGRHSRLARACVAVEGASDPLMYPAPERLLFASRRGEVLARLPAPPAFEVVGGFFGPARATDPAETGFPDIADLIGPWALAAAARDRAALAGLAAEAAARRLGPAALARDPTPGLARRLGAPGWAMAHTGPARALLFAPGRAPARAGAVLARAGFRQVLRFRTGPG